MIADGGGKILIVQDDAVFGSTIAASLAPLGHTCLVVTDTAAAIRYLQDFRPDLVLMDTNFPGTREHEAGAEWREFLLLYMLKRQQSSNVPFIVISDDLSYTARDQALAAGASDFFPKPLHFPRLLRCIQGVLSRAFVL